MGWDPIENLSLSKSSMGTFEECQRRWALQYQTYAFKGELRQEALYQKKLMGIFALTGQLVDDIITGSLRKYIEVGSWPKDKVAKAARFFLNEYLAETQRWSTLHAQKEPKPDAGHRQPIQEYFFNGLPDDAELERILADVERLVSVWYASEIPNKLEQFPTEFWRVQESSRDKSDALPPFFLHDQVKVWAKYDFIVQDPQFTTIYDWKTGKFDDRARDSVRTQLHLYALYAQREWGVEPGQIKMNVVWLAAGPEHCQEEIPYDQSVADRIVDQIESTYAILASRLRETKSQELKTKELFPMTENRRKCLWCNFRACDGYTDAVKQYSRPVEVPEDEPFDS